MVQLVVVAIWIVWVTVVMLWFLYRWVWLRKVSMVLLFMLREWMCLVCFFMAGGVKFGRLVIGRFVDGLFNILIVGI